MNLIGNTTTKTGLRIWASLDSPIYPTGIAVQDQEMAALNLEKAEFTESASAQLTMLFLRVALADL